MSSSIIGISDAIVSKIEDATFSKTINTIERKYVPEYDISDLAEIRVAVAPMALDPWAKLTRSDDQIDSIISIAVMHKLQDTDDVTVLDGYVAFALEIAQLLACGSLEDAPDAKLIQIQHAPLVDMAWFKNSRTFFSLITTTWRTTETVRCIQGGS